MAQQLGEAVVSVGPGRLKHLHFDAARVLMLLGAATAISTVGNPMTDATLAFAGFLLWLLGVCFLSLLMADRFPRAALVVAAMADAVLKHCFALRN
ncbi:hypothetical protein HU200_059179 [Digitaria exilis]|uniref:Uncharacterized protein n=1 Tax=Digitaria exilis TaxID=1010633 RepID=A0A835ACX4_9POAL|nr:hypothetical protein HU200_059179 [Digitaria exilis]